MYKKLITLFIVLVALVESTSCRAARSAAETEAPAVNIVTRAVKVPGNINAVKAGSIFNREIKQGPARVEITSSAEAIDATRFEVTGRTLSVRLEDNGKRNNNYPEVKIRISMPDIRLLEGSGASNFIVNGKLDVTDLEIKGNGASNFKFGDITCRDLDVDLSGASNVDILKVGCGECELDLSGGSTIEIGTLTCEELEADTSGAGNITISDVKCGDLEVDSSGGSNISINGIDAVNVECESSGAAHITVSGKCNTARLKSSGASKISARKLGHATIIVNKSGVSSINY